MLEHNYSVLMSVYENDKPTFLSQAIQSMVDQTVAFHDMVLVCDGPIPESLNAEIAYWETVLGARLNVVRLAKNGGLGKALQEGLRYCVCEVVARMDSDDISRPDRCEKLLVAMQDGKLDLVGGAIEEFIEVPGDSGSVRALPLAYDGIVKYSKTRNPFNHVSVMFHKEIVEAVGGYKPFHLMEDYYLWVRMLMGECRVANIPDVVVDVRVGDGMFERRSNREYLVDQRAFFGQLLKMGYISRGQYAKTMAARTVVTYLPAKSVARVYSTFLRKGGQDAK